MGWISAHNRANPYSPTPHSHAPPSAGNRLPGMRLEDTELDQLGTCRKITIRDTDMPWGPPRGPWVLTHSTAP